MLQPQKPLSRIATIDSNAVTFLMLGIVLTLLMVMMVGAPTHHGHGPDLPKVAHPVTLRDLDRDDVLLVSVAHDGVLYLGHYRINEADMAQSLRLRLHHGAERKLYVQADQRARYKSVSTVLDAAGSAGIYQVTFLADQLKNIQH